VLHRLLADKAALPSCVRREFDGFDRVIPGRFVGTESAVDSVELPAHVKAGKKASRGLLRRVSGLVIEFPYCFA
jgi:hypothetical protein